MRGRGRGHFICKHKQVCSSHIWLILFLIISCICVLKAGLPLQAGFYTHTCMYVSVLQEACSCKSLTQRLKITESTRCETERTRKHTSGSIQDAWNSLPAWFGLLPETPCWLRRTADKLRRSTQCLTYSTHNWKGVGWRGRGVKPSLRAGVCLL